MTRPKDIGTAGESAVVRVLRLNGWPRAERRALTGTLDRGDVTGTPGIVWEVKSGKAAETASDAQVAAWLAETDRERHNDNAAYGVLVLKRKAVGHDNAARWAAYMWSDAYVSLTGGHAADEPYPVRMTLIDAIGTLRTAGWGSAAA